MDPITRDFYEERRRKWRRSAFWRGVLATVLVLCGIAAVLVYTGDRQPGGAHIARIYIDDVIYTDPDRDAIIRDIADSDNVAALIVHFDSPGGTVVGSEALHDALEDVRSQKPVIAVLDGVAASGAYLAAMATDHVIARGNTITGSVGVIFEYLTFGELLDRVGVDVETIRSSDLKADPSLYRPLSPEGRAAEKAIVDETYAWFRALVAEARGLDGAALDAATDGRTFTGRMALEAGMIDAIGDEHAALDHLESVRGVSAGLDVKTWTFPEEKEGPLDFLARLMGISAGIAPLDRPKSPRLMSILK